MYFYFSSGYPAAIKLNGLYFGIITDSVKACDIKTEDNPFIEICPLSSGEKGVNFLLTENFLSSPPEGVSVTDLKGGYLIKFNASHRGGQFGITAQEKFRDAVVTVYNDDGYKISVETPDDFYIHNLSCVFKNVTVKHFYIDNNAFVSVASESEKTFLNVYSISGKIKTVFSGEVDNYQTDGVFITEQSYKDMAKHRIKTVWTFDGELKEKSREVTCSPSFSPDKLPERLLPYAFFEEYAAGGNFTEYLDENMKKKSDKLKGFLGKFIGVMPPPIFRSIDEVGLVYKKNENIYGVEYFILQLKDRKITNLKKV